MSNQYDIIIIGGGMVGASLVAALKYHSDKKIAVVEAFPFDSSSQPSFDDRSIALSYGSRRIWESMGLWEKLEPEIEAIKSIHVSDRGHLGATRINHTEEKVEALGYVVENRVMGRILMNEVQSLDHVDWYCPATIESLEQLPDQVSIKIKTEKGEQDLQAKLLVAADGVTSSTRQLAGLNTLREDYKQSAIIANVQTDQKHQGIAYERFTDSGPVAFLPMTENRYSVVWTCKEQETSRIMQLTDEEFINELQQTFGFRAGLIEKTGERFSYPLAYTEVEQLTKGRVVVIGNAAHALHPVSGQGYNLALRDVAELAEMIVENEDPGHALLLSEYHTKRLKDMHRVYRITDSMVKIFSNNFSPLGHLRASGLIAVNLISPVRSLMARQSMGLLGYMNKLQRRLPL
ncbi:MAG: 2-octaprenyl-6-methoxyphenyl hydroxylase [endosymbiont of Galathealinum brachiosum]|uniref:2-octaprenyl-6-methoxyphenyl hydroxylase n=1 Tax=endosymbiont of Galathealinum brachiosum TaxID=2200906 RepID=A0A370DDT3_9GAMM|nr:MAG: 2-octaprenyl-6-methoxyphenyl hydroxylase [endosymbiont of Galathealinum brachiosum]